MIPSTSKVAVKTRITQVNIFATKQEMGLAAAQQAAEVLRRAIAANGRAAVILASAASQFEILEELVRQDMDWPRVAMFHLDEYIGLAKSHPASFRSFLTQRFTSRVQVGEINFIEGDAKDPRAVCRAVGEDIRRRVVDLACIGIGENGHIAFNEPPADFDVDDPFIIVELDERSRRQQVGEGWYKSIDEVPKQAISMSIKEIMRANVIICTCPDARKAEAVRNTLEGPISPQVPATILRRHPDCRIFLDTASAGLI